MSINKVGNFVNLLSERIAKTLVTLCKPIIKNRNATVSAYDEISMKAFVYFENGNEVYEYYNKSGENLKENDTVRVFYTTNISKGWIAERVGNVEFDSKDNIDNRIIVEKKYNYYEIQYELETRTSDTFVLRRLLRPQIVVQGYVFDAVGYDSMLTQKIYLNNLFGTSNYGERSLSGNNVSFIAYDKDFNLTKVELTVVKDTSTESNGTAEYYLYINGVNSGFGSRFAGVLGIRLIYSNIAITDSEQYYAEWYVTVYGYTFNSAGVANESAFTKQSIDYYLYLSESDLEYNTKDGEVSQSEYDISVTLLHHDTLLTDDDTETYYNKEEQTWIG